MFMVEVEVPETQDEIDEKLEEDYKENKIDRKLKEIEQYEMTQQCQTQLLSKKPIKGVECLRNMNKSKIFEREVMKANCWICEGWSELRVKWYVGKLILIPYPLSINRKRQIR